MVRDRGLFTIVPQNARTLGINDILKDFSENCGNYNQVLKGGLALSYYYETKFPSARNTIDIDFHVKNEENWQKLKLEGVVNATKNSKINCIYSLGDEKITPNGASVTINYKTENINGKFKIDMNYGAYCKTRIVNSINIYSPEMILADKLSVICSKKIRRRTKDLYDVFLIISNEDFEFNTLVNEIKAKLTSRNIGLDLLSILDGEYLKDLEYSYYKIKLIDFPSFEEIVDKLLYFIPPVMDGVMLDVSYTSTWDYKKGAWSNGLYGGTFVMKSLRGIICKETASGILELSTFPPFPVLIYNEHIELKTSHFRFIKNNSKIEGNLELSEGLYVTNKERTIIDMLQDGEHRILMESLETYLNEGRIETLERIAKDESLEEVLTLRLQEFEEYNMEN